MSVAPTTAAAMAAHWDGRAHLFEGAAAHNRDPAAWRDVLAAALGPGRDGAGHVAVDLGCGTGACAVLLAELGYAVTGIDGSAGMLAEARRAAGARGVRVAFIHSDMDRAGLSDGCADVVTLRNVLWTLEQPAAALDLAFRLLRPGGRVMVSDGLWRRRPDPRLQGVNGDLPNACGVAEDEARAWLHGAGFAGATAWQDRFAEHPYGACYDAPETLIRFFVLSATKP